MVLAAVLSATLTERVDNAIASVSGPWLYVVAGVLTFAETGTLFFLGPGEIGLLVAGAAAGAGNLSLALMVLIANVAALLGDATGFAIGRRFGPRLRRSWLGSKIGAENWRRAELLIQRRRGRIVLAGRWIGFLRAIMPATAGMSGMSYRAFLPWDVAGCVSWATVCVVGGYLLGDNWHALATRIGQAGWVLAALAVVAFCGHWLWKRRRRSTVAPIGEDADHLVGDSADRNEAAEA
jgi:membrane protein DedA with SNARE-associated domain